MVSEQSSIIHLYQLSFHWHYTLVRKRVKICSFLGFISKNPRYFDDELSNIHEVGTIRTCYLPHLIVFFSSAQEITTNLRLNELSLKMQLKFEPSFLDFKQRYNVQRLKDTICNYFLAVDRSACPTWRESLCSTSTTRASIWHQYQAILCTSTVRSLKTRYTASCPSNSTINCIFLFRESRQWATPRSMSCSWAEKRVS